MSRAGAGRAAAAVLALVLVLTGCSGAGTPDPDPTATRTAATPTPAPVPEDEPDLPTLSADGGQGDEDEDKDKDEDEDEDEESGGAAGVGRSPFPDWMTPPTPDASVCSAPVTTRVAGADQLQAALDAAGPGTVIGLQPGTYVGHFVATSSGTAERPVRLCGTADTVLDGGGRKKGYVLHLDGAQHWVLHGFTIRNGQKGLVADGTTGTTISGLTVYGTGDEAVHLRRHSTDNLVTANTISDTGSRKPKFGEGVYIGTAHSNWCDITDCEPDLSDRNRVVGNAVYATTSEAVDIKEGTTGGVLSGNQLDGSATTAADSWVDVKGNGWTVSGNVGRNSPMDGFQTHDVSDGWGTRNVFSGNSGALSTDEGFLIALRPVNENRSSCDNRLLDDTGELSNEECR